MLGHVRTLKSSPDRFGASCHPAGDSTAGYAAAGPTRQTVRTFHRRSLVLLTEFGEQMHADAILLCVFLFAF